MSESFPVVVRVNASESLGELKPIWRFFGADEPNYAYMKNGQKLVRELGELRPGQVYFRAHNLLCTGDGTPGLKWGSTNAYTEDAEGHPIYDWKILDRIFSTYLQRGVRPYAQIGFMPKALSTRPEPYQHRWTPRARYEEIYTRWVSLDDILQDGVRDRPDVAALASRDEDKLTVLIWHYHDDAGGGFGG